MNRSLLLAMIFASLSLAGCKQPPPAEPPPAEPKPQPPAVPAAAPPPPAAAAPSAAAWQTLDTPTFTVEMPGAPEAKEGVEQTAAGAVNTTRWSAQTAGAFYAISIADYPKGMMKSALPTKVLEGARDGAMANVGGKVDKDIAVFLDSGSKKKYPGREFDGSTTAGIKLAARLFLVEDRLYQMISVSPVAAFNADDFKKFADSFKLKVSAAPKPGKRPRK